MAKKKEFGQRVKSLDLSRSKIPFLRQYDLISACSNLVEFDCSHKQLSVSQISQLFDLFSENTPHLKFLTIEYIFLQEKELSNKLYLEKFFNHSQVKLTHFTFGAFHVIPGQDTNETQNLGTYVLADLLSFLETNTSLVLFDIFGTLIKRHDLPKLAKSLLFNRTLKKLVIPKFESEVYQFLSPAITRNMTLRSINAGILQEIVSYSLSYFMVAIKSHSAYFRSRIF